MRVHPGVEINREYSKISSFDLFDFDQPRFCNRQNVRKTAFGCHLSISGVRRYREERGMDQEADERGFG